MHALMLIALIIIPFVFAVCAYDIPGLRRTRAGQGKTCRRLHVDAWNPGADLVHLRRCKSGACASSRTSAALCRSPRHHAAAMSARGALHPFHHRQDGHASGLHMLKEDAGGHIACLRRALHPAALGQPRVEHVSSTPTGRLLLPLRIAFHPGLREGQGIRAQLGGAQREQHLRRPLHGLPRLRLRHSATVHAGDSSWYRAAVRPACRDVPGPVADTPQNA